MKTSKSIFGITGIEVASMYLPTVKIKKIKMKLHIEQSSKAFTFYLEEKKTHA